MKDLVISNLIADLILIIAITIVTFCIKVIKNQSFRRTSIDRMEEKIEELHFDYVRRKKGDRF